MTAESLFRRTDSEDITATTQFRSAIDILAVFFVIGIATIVGAALLNSTPYAASPHSFWWAVAVGLLIYALLWWSTSYEISNTEMHVRCCGIKWRVPLTDIREVKDGIGLMKGGALTVRRLEVIFGPHQSVAVSPADREAFLSALGVRRNAA